MLRCTILQRMKCEISHVDAEMLARDMILRRIWRIKT